MPEENDPKLTPVAASASGTRRVERTRTFRRGLLAKLPKLPSAGWASEDTLDVFQEIQEVVQLDSDAFLEPLEKLAEVPHA